MKKNQKVMTKHSLIILAALMVLTMLVPISSHAESFTTFGIISDVPTWTNSKGLDVSGDGSTAVGQATYIDMAAGTYSMGATVKWSASSGMTILGNSTDVGIAYAVSYDGSVIAGGVNTNAFKWTESTGMVTLDYGTSGSATAKGITSDGTTLVGQVTYESGDKEAVVWDADGVMTVLGDLAGGDTNSEAIKISDNGSIILGNGVDEDGGTEAVIWKDGVIQSLGDLEGGNNYSEASDMSADGTVVVGVSSGEYSNSEAFIWTDEGGMVGLGDMFNEEGYTYSNATAISDDGSIIAGVATSGGTVKSFLYSEDGLVFLDELLEESGIDMSDWILMVNGMSADGSVLTGYATNDDYTGTIAWVVDLNASPVPIPGAVWLLGSGLFGLVGIRRRMR